MYKENTVMLLTISFLPIVVGINTLIKKLIAVQMKDLSYQWDVLYIDSNKVMLFSIRK